MIGAILAWLCGYATVWCGAESAAEVLELMRRGGFAHWHMRRRTDGGVSFRMRMREVRRLEALAAPLAAPPNVSPPHGLPAVWERLRGRWGLAVGAALCVGIVWLSTTVVWEIDVTGNRRLSDADIQEILAGSGFSVGTRFGSIDFDVLQNEILLGTDAISWIAINMQGSVAHVEVRERLAGRMEADGSRAANVVAAENGQILEISVTGGQAAVSPGDIVRAGELLIGGVISVGEDGVRFERAAGRVLAQVQREICVEIPARQSVRRYTGSEVRAFSLSFFGKVIKLSQNSGIGEGSYDKIIVNTPFLLPDGRALPVSWICETAREFSLTETRLTEAQAAVMARRAFREMWEERLADAALLSLETEPVWDGEVYRITAHAVCEADIARTAPLSVK